MGYTCGRKLDYDTCHKIAVKYKSITEFAKKDSSAYCKAVKEGWIDKWFKRKVNKPLTEEECRAIASQCKSRSEFKKKSHAAYEKARQNGWLSSYNFDDTCDVKKRALRTISDKTIEKKAKKYSSMTDFYKHDRNAWTIAYRRNLLCKFTWLSKNKEIALRGFKDSVYVYEFSNVKTAYVGRTVEPKRRDRHHREPGDSVFEFAKSLKTDVPPVKTLFDGLTTSDGKLLEAKTMEEYRQKGWTLINKVKAGSLGGLASGKLTKKYCISIAKKYVSVKDLVKNEGSVYGALRQHGWYKECTWLKFLHAPRGTWSKSDKEKIYSEAVKYTTRNEFMHGSKSAYERARREGWIDEWFPSSLRAPKKVGQFTITGKLIRKFNSIADAARAMNAKNPQISACCRGLRKTCHGFVFKFL